MTGMSTMTTDTGQVPDWTIGDRLYKALRANGIGVQKMADELGLSRNTLTNYLHDKTRIPRPTLIVWAIRTGVPLQWLETGQTPEDGPGNDDDGLPRLDSNQEPSGHVSPQVITLTRPRHTLVDSLLDRRAG